MTGHSSRVSLPLFELNAAAFLDAMAILGAIHDYVDRFSN